VAIFSSFIGTAAASCIRVSCHWLTPFVSFSLA